MNLTGVLKQKYIAATVPFLWGLFCVFLNFLPLSFFGYYHQSIPVILITIFYFAVFAPNKLNIFCVFSLGLLADLLSTAPFGIHAFIFSFLFFISNLARLYIFRFSFYKLWVVFSCFFFITDVVWAWLFCLTTGVWVSASFWFVQYIFTCLLYPLFVWLSGTINQKLGDN